MCYSASSALVAKPKSLKNVSHRIAGCVFQRTNRFFGQCGWHELGRQGCCHWVFSRTTVACGCASCRVLIFFCCFCWWFFKKESLSSVLFVLLVGLVWSMHCKNTGKRWKGQCDSKPTTPNKRNWSNKKRVFFNQNSWRFLSRRCWYDFSIPPKHPHDRRHCQKQIVQLPTTEKRRIFLGLVTTTVNFALKHAVLHEQVQTVHKDWNKALLNHPRWPENKILFWATQMGGNTLKTTHERTVAPSLKSPTALYLVNDALSLMSKLMSDFS